MVDSELARLTIELREISRAGSDGGDHDVTTTMQHLLFLLEDPRLAPRWA